MKSESPKVHIRGTALKPLLGWALAISLLTFALFSPAIKYKFVYFDDDQYVFENPMITGSPSWAQVKTAWTDYYASYWIPALWMSYMVDRALFGLDPGGFHFTNILLHALNTGILFLLLRRMTNHYGAAFLGAALFAWHPLRIESVAWITERKDVLSLFWGLLAVSSYLWYASRPRPARMAAVFIFMVIGLLTKPILLVLPLLLLLLDFWPLERSDHGVLRLFLEKLPLWAATLASAGLTVYSQRASISPDSEISLFDRIIQIPATYCFYIWKTIWPIHLTILYPDSNPTAAFLWLALFGMAMFTAILVWNFKKFPGITVGWGWFILALFPVSGIVRVGTVHLADRFTYLPAIGFSIAAAWILNHVFRDVTLRFAAQIIGWMVPVVLAVVTAVNLPRWQDSETLFRDAIAKAPHHVAYYNMGNLLLTMNKPAEAIPYFTEAARLKPDRAEAYFNLGTTLAKLGRFPEAIPVLETVCRLNPGHAVAWTHLANAQYILGQQLPALNSYRAALQITPDDPDLNNNVAWILATSTDKNLRDGVTAVRYARHAVELKPDHADFLDTLSVALAESGNFEEAVSIAEKCISRYRASGANKEAAEVEQRLASYRKGNKL